MINHWSLRRPGSPRASALCAALAFGGSAARRRWWDDEFNGNLSSSIAGAPDLVATDPLGTASFSGGVYNWTGAATPTSDQGGLSFDSTGLLNPSEYTVALTFKFNERDNAWRRIIDVDNRMSDDGFYVDPSNNLDVFPLAGSTSAFTTGVFHAVTLTVDGTIVTAFLDGVEQFKNLSTDIMDIEALESSTSSSITLSLAGKASGHPVRLTPPCFTTASRLRWRRPNPRLGQCC